MQTKLDFLSNLRLLFPEHRQVSLSGAHVLCVHSAPQNIPSLLVNKILDYRRSLLPIFVSLILGGCTLGSQFTGKENLESNQYIDLESVPETWEGSEKQTTRYQETYQELESNRLNAQQEEQTLRQQAFDKGEQNQ